MKLKQIVVLSALLISVTSGCKKTKVIPPVVTPPPTTPTAVASREELSKDSIFLYAKEVFLWNDALPTYEAFNPRQFTSGSTELANYNTVLNAIVQRKINSTTGRAYEFLASGGNKYSYISDITTQNPSAFAPLTKSAVDLEGNGNDLGLKLGAYGTSSTDANAYALFVTAVYQNSPADKAGMIRSNRITKVNGRVIGTNFNNDRDFINSAFAGTSIELEGSKYVNGVVNGTFSVSLTKANYKSSPVYAAKVFTAGSKKIGYLAYARFSTLTNSKTEFDAAFADFSTNGVTDLIIDLRYNGGGFINTAQYLINQIAPSSINGSIMFAEHYNNMMQSGTATILAKQPLLDANDKVQFQNGRMITYADVNYSLAANTEKFVKAGPLTGVTNIVFIVSGSTASASELVINSLRPFVNVKLVGTKTYGKPVGFFPIRIQNRYEVYYSMFTTKNSLGQGDYFDGFTPDIVDTFDDPLYNFGDAKENYTELALNSLAPGVAVISARANATMSIGGRAVKTRSLQPMKPVIDGNEFNGMIDTKHTLKR